MSTLLQEEPATRAEAAAARRLRVISAAVRLAVRWFGVRKSLTADQKAEAAESFGAEGEFLSAGKKLVDTRHPAFKAVTAVRTKAVNYWRGQTLPYPEPGLRLIRQDRIDSFDSQMREYREELAQAVETLDEHYAELRQAAARRLGRLYNPADYPESLAGSFALEWEFPSVEPPEYLQGLSPELYEQECRRVAARFDEAVRLAEQAFLDELHGLVSHLSERLTGQQDGRPKVFRDSAVENLTEFFERFRRLSVRSSEELDRLVEQARGVVRGVEPQSLRENQTLRQTVAQGLGEVQGVLDTLMSDRPRRSILRRPR